MTTETLIQQEDRQASWTIWRWLYCDDPTDCSIDERHHMEGDNDEHFIVQDFARHRIEAEERIRQSAYAAGIEDAAKKVLDLRAKNAADFDREGQAWKGYDEAILHAHAAIRDLGDHL